VAFSLFWVTEADICSIDAEVSSTLAACSLDDWDRLWAVALTSSDALESESAELRTSVMIDVSRSFMVFRL
jgi:hypothetical protein